MEPRGKITQLPQAFFCDLQTIGKLFILVSVYQCGLVAFPMNCSGTLMLPGTTGCHLVFEFSSFQLFPNKLTSAFCTILQACLITIKCLLHRVLTQHFKVMPKESTYIYSALFNLDGNALHIMTFAKLQYKSNTCTNKLAVHYLKTRCS